jgi:2-polyprenyl-6-methoxyphenol hydroxylase-like FAD-dependent oxidoreductase
LDPPAEAGLRAAETSADALRGDLQRGEQPGTVALQGRHDDADRRDHFALAATDRNREQRDDGDAAHTVPPTGAKGLNLALADVRVLAEVLEQALLKNDRSALDEYTERATARVWKAQHFSYWMTTMLHAVPEASDFDARRQLGELASVADSVAGATYLAEGYTGWPNN